MCAALLGIPANSLVLILLSITLHGKLKKLINRYLVFLSGGMITVSLHWSLDVSLLDNDQRRSSIWLPYKRLDHVVWHAIFSWGFPCFFFGSVLASAIQGWQHGRGWVMMFQILSGLRTS